METLHSVIVPSVVVTKRHGMVTSVKPTRTVTPVMKPTLMSVRPASVGCHWRVRGVINESTV